jgi:hypothetical protein
MKRYNWQFNGTADQGRIIRLWWCRQLPSVSGSEFMNSWTHAIWLFSEMNSNAEALTARVRESCDAPMPASHHQTFVNQSEGRVPTVSA